MKSLLAACLLAVAAAAPALLWAAPDDQTPPTAAVNQQVLLLLRLPQEHYRPESAYSGGYGDGVAHSARRRVAAALAREHGLKLATDWALPLLGVDCYVMLVPADQTPDSVAQALSGDPRVAWAQTMNVYRTRGHQDPLYPLQPAARAWQLSELHELSTGRDVRVAVVDSGVDEQHPDLVGQVVLKENFVDGHRDVPEQHGTAVAGIIAARADNGIGIVGVAPNARLLALRACWEEGAPRPAAPTVPRADLSSPAKPDLLKSSPATLCTSLSLAMALHYAVEHEAGVINLSLSGPPDRLLDRLLDLALSRRITVVGAVDPGQADGGFPASHAGVVAVTDGANEAALASALVAPGRDVMTTLPGARWNLVSGPSYAAAHVAGLFALMREGLPAHAVPPPIARVVSFSTGEIDACATLMGGAEPRLCVRTVMRSNAPNVRQ